MNKAGYVVDDITCDVRATKYKILENFYYLHFTVQYHHKGPEDTHLLTILPYYCRKPAAYYEQVLSLIRRITDLVLCFSIGKHQFTPQCSYILAGNTKLQVDGFDFAKWDWWKKKDEELVRMAEED